MSFLKNFSGWKKALFIGVLACGASLGVWCEVVWGTKKKWARIPVAYTAYTALPMIPVEIEGREYSFLLDTGHTSCFCMKKGALEAHRKKFERSEERLNFAGTSRVADVYVLPEIAISDFIARNFEVVEESDGPEGDGPMVCDLREDCKARLEQPIGKVCSGFLTAFSNGVLFDLLNSVVYFNADFAQLRKEGFSVEKWTRAPIELKRSEGIAFWAETDWGKKKFILDTGCTKSVIRKESVSEEAVSREWRSGVMACYSSQFSVEGKDFGEQSFLFYPLSEELSEIDGVLGMDFFKKHVVHLDFANRVAYFGSAEKR